MGAFGQSSFVCSINFHKFLTYFQVFQVGENGYLMWPWVFLDKVTPDKVTPDR